MKMSERTMQRPQHERRPVLLAVQNRQSQGS